MSDPEFNTNIDDIKRKKLNFLSSEALNNSIKNLTNPRFLGSIHMKKTNITPNISSIDSLVSNELELKINKSLKNSMMNPITITLILSMIVFNIIWLFLVFIL